MTDYATLEEVQTRRGGDASTVSDAWDDVITSKCGEVSRDIDRMIGEVRGCSGGVFVAVAAAEASARTFYARTGGSELLPIDDCISIASVSMTLTPGGSAEALVEGTDYRVVKSKGVIVALKYLVGAWPSDARIDMSARWGLYAAVTEDLREATIIEVIRSFLGDRSGNDDRLGMTPFGSIVTSKAFTSKVSKLVHDHRYGGASMRR